MPPPLTFNPTSDPTLVLRDATPDDYEAIAVLYSFLVSMGCYPGAAPEFNRTISALDLADWIEYYGFDLAVYERDGVFAGYVFGLWEGSVYVAFQFGSSNPTFRPEHATCFFDRGKALGAESVALETKDAAPEYWPAYEAMALHVGGVKVGTQWCKSCES